MGLRAPSVKGSLSCKNPAAEDMSVQENASQAENASSGESAKAASDLQYPEMTIILADSGAATDARQGRAHLQSKRILRRLPAGEDSVDVYPAGQLRFKYLC